MTPALPDDSPDASHPRPSRRGRHVLRWVLIVGLVCATGWFFWLYGQIHFYASRDQAGPADAIAVFGAAEYEGRPSPVLRARLDHALALYRQGLAPLVITLGGDGGENHSEGGVGHDYLLAHGVPEDEIIAETQSRNTEESAARLAGIARERPEPHPGRFRWNAPFPHSRTLLKPEVKRTHVAPSRSPPTRLLGRRHTPDA